MKTKMFVMVIVFLVGTLPVYAQIDSVEIDGYLMMEVPVSNGEDFTNRWSVINMTGSGEKAAFRIQYDFASQSLLTAHADLLDSAFGGQVNLTIGRTFMAVAQVTPALYELITPWWYEVYQSYTFVDDGICGSLKRDKFIMYLANNKHWSAAAVAYGFVLLWQEGLGGTASFEAKWNWLMNPFVGVTWYQTGGKQHSFSNFSEPFKGIKIYQTFDYGRVDELSWGICWDSNNQIRLKGNYAFMAEKAFLEVVCTF